MAQSSQCGVAMGSWGGPPSRHGLLCAEWPLSKDSSARPLILSKFQVWGKTEFLSPNRFNKNHGPDSTSLNWTTSRCLG